MTLSNRKPAATPATGTPAKAPAAPTPRGAAAAAASKTAVRRASSPTAAVAAKTARKPGKVEKRVRTSFTLPESQIALLGALKKRCLGFGVNAKKGELLSAGLQLLKNLPETALEAALLPLIRSDRQPETPKQRKK